MNVKICSKNLSGEVTAIPSKSQLHRVIIASALRHNVNCININDDNISDDIEATMECIKQLDEDLPVFNCRESASTLRFLLPISMALKNKAKFKGTGRLKSRPLSPLKEQLEEHGCVFESEGDDICTLTGALKGGKFTLPGSVSSQFITGLLFALPLLDESSEILLTSPLQSVNYVTMTLRTLEKFGIKIDVLFDEESTEEAYLAFRIKGKQKYIFPAEDISMLVDGDWSNAAFWLAAGVISTSADCSVTCSGLNLTSEQGDRKITSVLKAFGGKISKCDEIVTVSPGELNGIEIDAMNIPDLIPVISVVASVSSGTTKIVNAERLRLKESDRLHTVCVSLTELGADVTETEDGLVITGKNKLSGGVTDSFNDHRIPMAAAVLSAACIGPVTIKGAEAVNKSYPRFFEDFKTLGGVCECLTHSEKI
jgi:3-phosphoshikimate 1-carboxyvinyltransferase